ncbi:MAG: electron transport complex subunit RsxE, partial [Candidatus Thiodiazotropha sp.]|jgi:electron transport complex protein RnfE
LIPDYKGFLLIILPPGGFLVLGFLLAGKRLLDRLLAQRKENLVASEASASSQ